MMNNSNTPHPTPTSAPKIWAVVLSRAGSQRLPNKAMRPLFGKPMAGWVLQALSQVDGFDLRFLFTDDSELLSLAHKQFPDIHEPNFQRPASTSEAKTSSLETLRYFLQQFSPQSLPDWVMLCQCTSPLVQPEDYEAALIKLTGLLESGEINPQSKAALVSVCPPPKPVRWLLQGSTHPTETERLHPIDIQPLVGENQYLPNGAFYLFPTALILDADAGFNWMKLPQLYPVVMPWQRSIDIDTHEDFKVAEAFLNMNHLEDSTNHFIKALAQPMRPNAAAASHTKTMEHPNL